MSRGAKIAVAVLGVAVVAIAIVVVVMVESSGPSDQPPSKRVTPDALKRFDTIVVLPRSASASTVSDVEARMNRFDAVDQYAEVPHNSLAYLLSLDHDADAAAALDTTCASKSTRGYVVALSDPTPDARRALTTALRDDVTVRPASYRPPKTEIFMQVRATQKQADGVVRALRRDADIVSYRFLDHNDAYKEFKRLFADQPVLTESEKPENLPESFRLDLRDGASPNAVAARYQDLPGVDMVNVPVTKGVPSVPGFDVCPSH